jgi:hypothetical protein
MMEDLLKTSNTVKMEVEINTEGGEKGVVSLYFPKCVHIGYTLEHAKLFDEYNKIKPSNGNLESNFESNFEKLFALSDRFLELSINFTNKYIDIDSTDTAILTVDRINLSYPEKYALVGIVFNLLLSNKDVDKINEKLKNKVTHN